MEPIVFGVPWPEFNEGVRYHDTVSTMGSVPTLLEFYCSNYNQSASREGWLQRISNGQISVNGQVIRASGFKLRLGDSLEYHRLPWGEPWAPYCLHVLYEDTDLVAVNKPAGLQVLPGGLFQQRTVLMQLQWKTIKEMNGVMSMENSSLNVHNLVETAPVHRLGRGTSGILLCAKSTQAKSKLGADFAASTASNRLVGDSMCRDLFDSEQRLLKSYRALASGIIQADEIIIEQPIGRVKYAGVAGGLYMASPTGKPSCSKVTVLGRNAITNCSLVEVKIFTGRPHQIRIHLASIGHPLVGDPLYASGGIPSTQNMEVSVTSTSSPALDGGYSRPILAVPGDCGGYYLHAHQLTFHHPVTNEKILLVAPAPQILCAVDEL